MVQTNIAFDATHSAVGKWAEILNHVDVDAVIFKGAGEDWEETSLKQLLGLVKTSTLDALAHMYTKHVQTWHCTKPSRLAACALEALTNFVATKTSGKEDDPTVGSTIGFTECLSTTLAHSVEEEKFMTDVHFDKVGSSCSGWRTGARIVFIAGNRASVHLRNTVGEVGETAEISREAIILLNSFEHVFALVCKLKSASSLSTRFRSKTR